MRQVTATEKYRAVNEGKMAKGEFVRQMRMAYPSVISQWNSYNDTVTILKNRGYITEKTGVDTYDSRMDLNISPSSIDRGVRYELQGQGVDPVEVKDKELVAKVTDRVIKNLKKDPLHYINLLAGESSNVDKHDREEEVKRGEAKKDVFNGEKKADLKESIESAKENIIKVASEIRAKYGEIPGFTSILKDFLQTHQDDIKAGNVTDPIAEFDNYIDLNYDRLDEKESEVNERGGHYGQALISVIKDMAADFDGDEVGAAEEAMEFIGQEYEIDFEFGAGESRQMEEKKADKDYDGDGKIESGEEEYKGSKDRAIKSAMGKSGQLKEAVKNIIQKVLSEEMINEAATAELARLADDYSEFEGMKQSIIALQDIVTDIESFYDKTRDKIQKVYDSIGEIRNEEGLKVGAFIAPSIEAAFNKDLRPAVKRGFTAGLETPKVKTISKAEVDAARAAGEIEEEPKQTLFTPINEAVKLSDLFQGDKPNPNIVTVPNQHYNDEKMLRYFAERPSRKDGNYVIFSRIGGREGGESRYEINGDEVMDIISFEDAKKNL